MLKLMKMRKKLIKNFLIFLLLILIGYHCFHLLKCFLDNWEISDWRKNSNRYLVNYIMEDDHVDIESLPKNFCRENTYLLTIVTSAPQNKEKRMLIRHGFGHINIVHGKNVTTYFIIGKSNDPDISILVGHKIKQLFANVIYPYNLANKTITEEEVKYNDIIRGKFIDHYNNLTLKVAVSFGIVSRYCKKTARFLMKTDDDVIANYPVIIKDLINKYSSLKYPFIVGRLDFSAQRIMNPFSKWFVPTYMYFGGVYPDFASGTGYIMTAGISGSLFEASFDVPMIHMEDTAVSEEEAIYNDIVQGNFIDHYNNLTLKVGLLFGTISKYCDKNVKFLMKTDDDVIANYPVIVKDLTVNYSLLTGPFIVGRLHHDSHRITDPFDKWYVPTYMYSGTVYPTYAGGSGYIVTSEISNSLFEASFDIPIIHMEDVYFTGIIAKEKLGINLLNDDKFYCRWDKENFEHCFDKFIFHGEHGIELADIKQLYSEFCSYMRNNNTEYYNIWNCTYFYQ